MEDPKYSLENSLKILEDNLRPADVYPTKVLAEYLSLNGLEPFLDGSARFEKTYRDIDILAIGSKKVVDDFVNKYNDYLLMLISRLEPTETLNSLDKDVHFLTSKEGHKECSFGLNGIWKLRPEFAARPNYSEATIEQNFNARPLIKVPNKQYLGRNIDYQGNLFVVKPKAWFDIFNLRNRVQTNIDLSLAYQNDRD